MTRLLHKVPTRQDSTLIPAKWPDSATPPASLHLLRILGSPALQVREARCRLRGKAMALTATAARPTLTAPLGRLVNILRVTSIRGRLTRRDRSWALISTSVT